MDYTLTDHARKRCVRRGIKESWIREMKLEFDPTADAAYFEISSTPVERTEEIEPGINADYDTEGHLISIEVLSVSKRKLSEHLE